MFLKILDFLAPFFFLPVMFYTLENNYFGWNKYPESPEEVIADGIVFLLTGLAWIIARLRTREFG